MRKDETELLDNIEKLTLSQFYLLQVPRSPQQQFLHLFAHRTLATKGMFHRNLDRIRPHLVGTFAQAALETAVITAFVENHVDCAEETSPMIDLIQGWVNFYPSLRSNKREKYSLSDIVLQDGLESSAFGGYAGYLSYLNIISTDLWKLIRNKKNEQEFLNPRPVKQELREILLQKNGRLLDPNDLLTFVSGCIPKTLLNIILTNDGLPAALKNHKNFECLYSNQAIQYLLRRHEKLALLLKHVLMILITLELNAVQQKFLMLVTMRFFYVFHFERKYSSSELVVHAFNKLTDQVKKVLSDEFSLFFKVILKLGKQKFTDFVASNSTFARGIIEMVMKRPMIGYPQESANPYNTAGVAEVIDIDRGASATRTFQILQDFSIFYFRIEVVSLDITVRLYYLGQVTSPKQVKTLLFTHEKVVGQLKNSVNAVKKGLYRFQFDNSSSWINGKRIRYENQVFTPLEIKTTGMDEWIDDFYGNIPLNELANEEEIVVVDNKRSQREKQKEREGLEGVAVLERRGNLLKVGIKKRGEQYVYETDNVERMVQKTNELAAAKEKYQWQVDGKTVQRLSDIENFIRGQQIQTRNEDHEDEREEKREQKKKETIDLQEYKEEDDENEVEYEVVRHEQLQRSQIINESSKPLPSDKSTNVPPSKPAKETIDCNFQEMEQASS